MTAHRSIIATLELEDLRALMADELADVDDRLEAAVEVGARAAVTRDAEHAAEHGRTTLRYGRVAARRGYRGDVVCLDCYYGRAIR